MAGYRIEILNPLDKIIRSSPDIPVFVTGKPHIQVGDGERLLGRVPTIHLTPTRDDIISYLYSKLDEDTTPDAVSSLEENMRRKLPKIFLRCTVRKGIHTREATSSRPLTDIYLDSRYSR